MSIQARVLADSISDRDHRLITVEVTFPRYLLSEFNTHRMFSRNSASSRAIPPEKQLERIRQDPFIPYVFYGRAKGMGQDGPLPERKQEIAHTAWLAARDRAVAQAGILLDEGVSKSTVNRLLEPFMWHTVIVTATEWENFFALRCPPGYEVDTNFPAEPEIQRTALAMREVMRASTPLDLGLGQWHLPLVDREDYEIARKSKDQDPTWDANRWLAEISAGRCARVSFDRHDDYEDQEDSRRRADRLLEGGHLSPFEHPATPGETSSFYQNLQGWKSLRHEIPHQENRVGFLDQREPWDHAGLPEHQPTMGGEV